MKKLFVALVIANIIVGLLYFSAEKSVELPAEKVVPASECVEISFATPQEQAQFIIALNKLSVPHEIVEATKWVEGSNKWLVSELQTGDLAKIRQLVPGAYLINSGPYKGRFSLGIFSKEENGRRLQGKFSKKAIKTELLPYQQKVRSEHVVTRLQPVEPLVNAYHIEFIEKKSCLGVVNAL